MDRSTTPVRVRALRATIWVLDRALAACVRSLPAASAHPPDMATLFRDDVAVEHPHAAAERLLVFQILERPGVRSRAELEIALGDIEPFTASDAFSTLEAEGVLHTSGERVWASRCVRHLDTLGFISV